MGRVRFSLSWGFARKYIKKGEREAEGTCKGWMMVLIWMLVLKIVDSGL